MKNRSREKEGHLIISVEKGSIADQMDVKPGDRLLSVNGQDVEDVFDYRYFINSESVVLDVLKENGEEWELEIDNEYEDPGLVFESSLMSDYRSCSNNCIFCFIDQMPPGMRDTLYFKDDDSRLSFLQGNYVTLTNMKEKDIDRIIHFKLEPINISVHTTNSALRNKMLHNRFAGRSLKYLKTLYDAGITMNGQIVLVKGWNDGEELEHTLKDLLSYAPVMQSVSVVPVGLTKFRENLPVLKPFEKADAEKTVDCIERIQKTAMEKAGIHFAHASDEFYLLAGRPLPEEGRYDGYLQLENGVGMLRLLDEEVKDAVTEIKEIPGKEELSLVTGMLAYPFLSEQKERIRKALPDKKLRIIPVENRFFGEKITVTGLLTGKDIIEQLRGKKLGSRLLLPVTMFRSGEEVLLDDLTRADIEKALGVKTVITGSSGYDLLNAVNDPDYTMDSTYEGYELKDGLSDNGGENS